MKNYQYVLEFKKEHPEPLLIKNILNYAWKNTPSKNNFMNYSVHVIKPSSKDLRLKIFYKCLEKQSKSNGNHIQGLKKLQEYESHLKEIKAEPLFRNVKSAPYIIIYTQRVVDKSTMNSIQQQNTDKGMVYEQTFDQGTKKFQAATHLARLEIGMFANNFANKCLTHNVDVSYIACMPSELEYWSEPEFSFIKHKPLLIQLAGYGDVYRRDFLSPEEDRKPQFEEVVNLLEVDPRGLQNEVRT